MLKIRLQRVGRSKEPTFRLVLTDSKNGPQSGKFLEVLGSYDSRRGEKSEFNADRIKHWMSMGAHVSETVHNILIDKKLISGKKINVLPRKSPIKKEGDSKSENVSTQTQKTEAVEQAQAPEQAPAQPAEQPAEQAPEPANV